jgi:hypothetical protein
LGGASDAAAAAGGTRSLSTLQRADTLGEEAESCRAMKLLAEHAAPAAERRAAASCSSAARRTLCDNTPREGRL